MPSVNKVILVGRVGQAPIIRYTKGGQAVASFSLATSEKWTGKDGQKEEKTEWHRIVAWGKLGEICGEYLEKGKQVYIEGRLQTREWEDDNGNKRQTTEIVANNMTMLGGGNQGAGNKNGSQGGYDGQGDDVEEHPADCECPECDSIPF